jgi:hypothetical protein
MSANLYLSMHYVPPLLNYHLRIISSYSLINTHTNNNPNHIKKTKPKAQSNEHILKSHQNNSLSKSAIISIRHKLITISPNFQLNKFRETQLFLAI